MFAILSGREARVAELQALLPENMAELLAELEEAHPDLPIVNVAVKESRQSGAYASDWKWRITFRAKKGVLGYGDSEEQLYLVLHEYAHLSVGCQFAHTKTFWQGCFRLVEKFRPQLMAYAKDSSLVYKPRGASAALNSMKKG